MGSSPHARGTHDQRATALRHLGIIPACAGNTLHPPTRVLLWRDHPRMRGEHPRCRVLPYVSSGSSPHARGTLLTDWRSTMLNGIIPACAGNTHGNGISPPCSRDHPRMRGEHADDRTAGSARRGSSPHARGTQVLCAGCAVADGIIPACAGNTSSTTTTRASKRDHPRMRGEHPDSFPPV